MKKMTRVLAVAIVLVTLATVLASCAAKPNADPALAYKALLQNNYQMQDVDPDLYAEKGVEKLKYVVQAVRVEEDKKGNAKVEGVTILYFEDAAAAKAALSKATGHLNIESVDSFGSKYIVKQSGSMIYAGTKNAIKAAK